jgi:predicted peptidase
LNIDANRIYLTGLSMGGRGTFIVAAELSNTFAAIMPLSPHHTPYSYLSLAEKVSHLPTFLHHSTNDKTSKFSVAEDMFSKLSKINDNVVFDIGNFGHSGWNKIYSNPKHIEWLLSWRK